MSRPESFRLAFWVDTPEQARDAAVDWVAREPGMTLVGVRSVDRKDHHWLVMVDVRRPPMHIRPVLDLVFDGLVESFSTKRPYREQDR